MVHLLGHRHAYIQAEALDASAAAEQKGAVASRYSCAARCKRTQLLGVAAR